MFYFDNFSDFLAMGRHGVYVWSAYAIALAILVVSFIAPLRQGKAQHQAILRQIRRESAQKNSEES